MKNQVLEISNVRVDQLVEKYSTPLFVYDEEKIVNRINDFYKYFKSKEFSTEVIYASKAFTCGAMIDLLKDMDTSLDVVSGGELYLAHKHGFDMNKVFFHGNNKTNDELCMAIKYGCKIVADNIDETKRIAKMASECKKHMQLLLRVNPGVEAHTHEYIITAKLDSKFGISITLENKIDEVIQVINDCEYLSFYSFHSHIGSQIFDTAAFKVAIETMVNFTNKYNDRYNMDIEALNIGGGFGVRYTSEDNPIPFDTMCKGLIEKLEETIRCTNSKIRHIMIEPGRSIVGEAGYTLYTVGYQKKTTNKKYVFVDGGMSDNIRVSLYQAKYACDVANKMNDKKTQKVTVAGKCCESGDILAEDILLPEVKEKDILVFYTTGAYGYSMSSNYNRLNKPAVVFVNRGKARLVVKRETYEDQYSLDVNEEFEF